MSTLLQDPVTTAWVLALGALFGVVALVPIARLAVAVVLYAAAALTGRAHLRRAAARVMPRIGHLIGGLVVGAAAVIAAPAMAASHPGAVDLDRDSGEATAPASAAAALPQLSLDRATAAGSPTSTTLPRSHERASRAIADVYVVKVGDTLWDIASTQLDDPTDAQVTERWKAIWRSNRAVLGDHPELIHPGDELRIGNRS